MEIEKQKIYPRDPFAVDPLPRAHYHPSKEKRLTREQKQTAISPRRQLTEDRNSKKRERNRLSPMDEIFLRNTNFYQPKMTSQYQYVEDNDEKFDESWPSSKRPSSMNLTGLEEESPINMEQFQATVDRFTDLKKTLSFPEHESPGTSPQLSRKIVQPAPQKDPEKNMNKKSGIPGRSQIPVRDKSKSKVTDREPDSQGGSSVLQRYIERFRNSAPLSREERERQKENASKDFWWLSSSPPSAPAVLPSSRSMPKEEDSGGGRKSRRVTPLTTDNLDKYSNLQKLKQNGYQKISEVPPSPGDKRTRELQERAEKLLERSSSSVASTEPAVSTEGLGSNTSGMSSLEEYSYRPKFAQFLDKEENQKYSANPYAYKSDIPRQPVSQARPEDDPLHQWRLRRRMEQAQETAPKSVPSFGFLTKTEQQRKVDSQLEEYKRKLAGKDISSRVPQPGRSSRAPQPAYQFTPAPTQGQLPKEEEPPIASPEPHIASPILHRRKPRPDCDIEVDPHLHLMCDLLPCPHRGKYSDISANLQSDKNSRMFHKDTTAEKLKHDELLRPSEINDSPSNTLKNNKDKNAREDEIIVIGERGDSERLRKDESKYKQFLEAEKPDVESRSDSERSVTSDRSRKKREKKRSKVGKESFITSPAHSDSENKALNNKEMESKKDKQEIHGLSERTASDSEGENAPDKGQRSRNGRSRSLERKKEKLRPRLSSSPKTERRVDEAIGQVVKNHLFSMSTSTVISSVDSLPPSASVEGLPRVPELRDDEQGTRGEQPGTREENDEMGENKEDDSYHSDDGFQDDHLLQILRKQRAEYELQLREIDAMLSKVEPR